MTPFSRGHGDSRCLFLDRGEGAKGFRSSQRPLPFWGVPYSKLLLHTHRRGDWRGGKLNMLKVFHAHDCINIMIEKVLTSIREIN